MTLELRLEGWFPEEQGQGFQTERDAHAGPHGRKGQAVVPGQDRRRQWGWRGAAGEGAQDGVDKQARA